jgi:hypothetical protein
MTRVQKAVLAILGLLNIIVIVILGNIVVWNVLSPQTVPFVTPSSRAISDSQLQVAYCPSAVMSSLPLSLHPVVDWEEQQLRISLQDVYTTTIPPTSSAQYLWTAMDAVAAALRAGCAPPQTVTLAMSAYGRLDVEGVLEVHHHIVKLEGQDVMAWTVGTLSNEALANQADYRQIISREVGKRSFASPWTD